MTMPRVDTSKEAVDHVCVSVLARGQEEARELIEALLADRDRHKLAASALIDANTLVRTDRDRLQERLDIACTDGQGLVNQLQLTEAERDRLQNIVRAVTELQLGPKGYCSEYMQPLKDAAIVGRDEEYLPIPDFADMQAALIASGLPAENAKLREANAALENSLRAAVSRDPSAIAELSRLNAQVAKQSKRLAFLMDRIEVHIEETMAGTKRKFFRFRIGQALADGTLTDPKSGWTDLKYFDQCRARVDVAISAALSGVQGNE